MSVAPKRGDSDEELDSLLRKLRPFQREAFDFATKSNLTAQKSETSKKKENHDGRVKGRILLADEMVCLSITIYIT